MEVEDCAVCLSGLGHGTGTLVLGCHHVLHACCLLEAVQGA